MNINGWGKENEKKITLPSPYDLTFFEFAEGSSSDFILEIKKGKTPHLRYRHVSQFRYLPGKKAGAMAVDMWERRGRSGAWRNFRGILDVASGRRSAFPEFPCADRFFSVAGELLVTHSDKNRNAQSDPYRTQVCIWNRAARLIGSVEMFLYWKAYNEFALQDKIGITSADPMVFYAVSRLGEKSSPCYISLQHITDQTKSARFRIPDENPGSAEVDPSLCDQVEVDFDALTLNSQSARYRRLDGNWKTATRDT